MRSRRRSAAAAAAVLTSLARAQDMRGACVSCGDLKSRCELRCFFPQYREVVMGRDGGTLDECLDVCGTDDCQETAEAKTCFTCVENCATTYEGAMLECLQMVPSTTMTFDRNLGACSIDASNVMDQCASQCYGLSDPFFGWSPGAEEGNASQGRPFDVPAQPRPTASFAATRPPQDPASPRPWIPAPSSGLLAVVGLGLVVAGCAIERFFA